jgi:SAM-dependent methyltransferase
MLHKVRVARAIKGNLLSQARIFLGRKPRGLDPQRDFTPALHRHTELVRRFLAEMPADWDLRGKLVSEIGCCDCLAIAGLLIGMGAEHVDLVEPCPPVLDSVQVRILKTIQQNGFKLETGILQEGREVTLDKTRVTYHHCTAQALAVESKYDYLFSYAVLEHVEDLPGFYAACRRTLKPGGRMFHCIDFSGHGELEDPVPPLDFQTYPDWLFNLMYPRHWTRLFLSDHQGAITRAGLVIDQIRVGRRADHDYVERLRPKLRRKARLVPLEEVSVLEATIVSHKCAH